MKVLVVLFVMISGTLLGQNIEWEKPVMLKSNKKAMCLPYAGLGTPILCDWNNDGKEELFVGFAKSGDIERRGRMMQFDVKGKKGRRKYKNPRVFKSDTKEFDAIGGTLSNGDVKMQDIDGDGIKDIVSFPFTAGGVEIWYGQENGKFSAPVHVKDKDGNILDAQNPLIKGFKGFSGFFVDWDGDNDMDLFLTSDRPSVSVVFINEGNGKSIKFTSDPIKVQDTGGKAVAGLSTHYVDWDMDGIKDIVCGGGYDIRYHKGKVVNGKLSFEKAREILAAPSIDKILSVRRRTHTELAKESDEFSGVLHFSVIDYNEDGKNDLLINDSFKEKIELEKWPAADSIKYVELGKEYDKIIIEKNKVCKSFATAFVNNNKTTGEHTRKPFLKLQEITRKMISCSEEQRKYAKIREQEYSRVWVMLQK